MNGPQRLVHRPTLLVGYGAFGRDALRRLLAATAPRGLLRWNQPEGGSLPGERSLLDLSLLWVPDRWDLAGQPDPLDDVQEGSSFEMMRDLYRQIHTVEKKTNPEIDLADALEQATTKLLSATSRAVHQDDSPLGLDVIVLAQPAGPEVIGILDRMMAQGMKRLANNSNLIRAVQGVEALNFLEILDFDNYWSKSPEAAGLRRVIYNSVERWQLRKLRGETAFSRIYLVDGRTKDGIRDARLRLDEINLFLEFLIFEGQRSHLQQFYQSAGSHEPILATFGIRLFERSSGLLSRLVAAYFGAQWLDTQTQPDPMGAAPQPHELRTFLEPYPARLDELLGAEALQEIQKQETESLEKSMLALDFTSVDWPDRARACFRATFEHLQLRSSKIAAERLEDATNNRLQGFSKAIVASIDADLCHDRNPTTLGATLREAETALRRFEEPVPPSSEPKHTDSFFQQLASLHAEYRRFVEQRLDPHRHNQRWWPLFALALAAGITYPLVGLLDTIPDPDPTRFLLVKAREALRWLNHPPWISLLAFSFFWLVGRYAFGPKMVTRVRRSRQFYEHPDRGRLVDRIRSALNPGGTLRRPMEYQVEQLLEVGALSVRGEISRSLGRIVEILRRRRREVIWLQNQLRQFLTLHGLYVEEGRVIWSRKDRLGSGARFAAETSEDFDRLLETNPPTPERFRSVQANIKPFEEWNHPYGRALLYPLHFVDRLSTIYQDLDPFLQELAQAQTGPEQDRRREELLEFLSLQNDFDLAFSWQAQEGLPTDRRIALISPIWHGMEGILRRLSDIRVSQDNIYIGSDIARAYLLRMQLGVDPSCLLAEGEKR